MADALWIIILGPSARWASALGRTLYEFHRVCITTGSGWRPGRS